MATMPTGTFTRNTQRQPAVVTRTPPSEGPTAAASPAEPDHKPIARPRRLAGMITGIMASVCGVISAPPTPCSTRAAIRIPADGASAQATDAAPKTTMPTISKNLGP